MIQEIPTEKQSSLYIRVGTISSPKSLKSFDFLVRGFNPVEKYAEVKLDDFPKDWGEHVKNVSNHYLVVD